MKNMAKVVKIEKILRYLPYENDITNIVADLAQR